MTIAAKVVFFFDWKKKLRTFANENTGYIYDRKYLFFRLVERVTPHGFI